MILKTRDAYRAFRISPGDTNKMVMVFDPHTDRASFTCVIEVFDVGGRTPPNRHEVAQEMFYVLSGRGRAHAQGHDPADFETGDSLLVPAGGWHEIENTGDAKLYCLTMMTPNEGFAEMILAGTPDGIDDEDWAVIGARPAAA